MLHLPFNLFTCARHACATGQPKAIIIITQHGMYTRPACMQPQRLHTLAHKWTAYDCPPTTNPAQHSTAVHEGATPHADATAAAHCLRRVPARAKAF